MRLCSTTIKITGPSKVLFLVSPRTYYDTVIKEPMRTSSLKTDMAFLGGILKTEMYMVDVNVTFQLSPNKEHEMQCTVVHSPK